jgi:hypothetical protein
LVEIEDAITCVLKESDGITIAELTRRLHKAGLVRSEHFISGYIKRLADEGIIRLTKVGPSLMVRLVN